MPEASVTWNATNPVTIDWGDGSAAGSGAATGTATHTYAVGGPHTITITDTVTAAQAAQTIDCPVATCALTVTAGARQSATATLTAGATDTYTIDWGDSTTSTGAVLNTPVNHTYAAAGNYTVSARNDTFPTVGACTAPVVIVPTTFAVVAADATAGVAPFDFSVQIDPDHAGIDLSGVAFDIDWGDGSAHTTLTWAPPTPVVSTHTYAAAGSYTPSVTRTDTGETHPMTGGPVTVS